MKDAYYFSHDSNASTDTKILSMRCDYGLEGYGMYWVIVEALRNETNYKLPHTDNTIKALAMQMHCKSDTVKSFVDDCINEYKLFVSDGEHFWANTLLRRMKKLENIREKRKKAAEKRWNKEKDKQKESKSNANALQDYAKESKVKESKVNNKTYSAFFEEVWSLYPNKKGKGKISDSKKQEIYKLGDEFKRCISRYVDYVEDRKNTDFPELKYQNGSTFFNSGYVDYLDKNSKEPVKEKKPPLKLVFRDVLGNGGEPYGPNSADKG